MLKLARAFMVVACVAIVPTMAYAQSSITGVVRDTSGAVLPGVTVEAASPELIEKVRDAVTDGTGQYRILDLRPGTYTVTFTLTGFSTVKREGLVLPADFVSTVNADLRIGALEETVTVTGESPIVDVQSIKKVQTLDLNMIQSIPTARGYAAVMLLIPSMVTTGGTIPNVQLSPGMIVFGGRGGRQNEGQSQLDGLGTGAAINGGGVSGYGQLENAQEVVMTTAGGLGEVEVGGPVVNMIPKTGGNTFQNHFYGSGMSGWMQSRQLRSDHERFRQRRRRVPAENPLSVGHQPFARRADQEGSAVVLLLDGVHGERQLAARHVLQQERRRHHQVDLRAGLQPSGRERQRSGLDQANAAPDGAGHPRNKLNMFWDPSPFRFADNVAMGGITGPTAGAPETGTVSGGTGWKQGTYGRLEQIRWTSTTTNRLLLEAGLGTYQQNWNGRERPGNNRALIPVTEQCTAGCPNNGNIQGLVYRAQNWNTDFMEPIRWNASATYNTGSHNMKVGYIGAYYWITSGPPPTTPIWPTASTTACRTRSRRI